ncbi:MAG TPA: hypothetical protein VHY09_15375 [Candidatus Methylacidiphilales bacterium]|jgi:hypothetical protein|nr:hypothetical protein [Candidatus Methylacidiphilales bacterium]
MQQPEDKQASFGDWALAQRTRPNEVLEKIAALIDLSKAEGPPGGGAFAGEVAAASLRVE